MTEGVEAAARGGEARSTDGGTAIWNWTREQVSYPQRVVEAHDVETIRGVLRDEVRYPSPVRALGSRHSTTRCGEADGGTVVDVRPLNRILRITDDTVTVEPGALYIDVAKELERRGLQFNVNIELGNLSMGAAAMCATKDASMPGELGQVNSYAIGLTLVTPSGELVEVTENDPELLRVTRSSYGLLGIAAAVTFRVRPLQAMAVYHEVYRLEEFLRRLPELIARNESMMLYIFPFVGQIVVEFRTYTGAEAESRSRAHHLGWHVRNFAWSKAVPAAAHFAERYVPSPRNRYAAINAVNRVLVPAMMRGVVTSKHTIPTDQMIRYPSEAGRSKYTFSIWAFPEEAYSETLREYFGFVQSYYRRKDWRPNMTHVGYRIARIRARCSRTPTAATRSRSTPSAQARPAGKRSSTRTTSSAVHAAAPRSSTRPRG